MADLPLRASGLSDGLLPCPFCGGEARTTRREDESLWSHAIVWWSEVSCSTCDIRMLVCDDPAGESVRAAWNQRPPSVPLPEGAREPNYAAALAEYCRVTAYWPPEWINSPDHFEKMLDSVLMAAALHPEQGQADG